MLSLYGVYRSRASRPLWLLGEIGMEFRHVPVIQAYRLADPMAADAPLNTAQAVFLAVNPRGQVPALVEDDGFVLTESLAITLYIAKRHGGDLGPGDLREDALMMQWALFAATGIEGAARSILNVIEAGEAETPEGMRAIAEAQARLRPALVRLEGTLADRAWLVGDRFTAAEICVAECLRYAQGHVGLLADSPALADWLARCQERPAFRAMLAAQLAEPD